MRFMDVAIERITGVYLRGAQTPVSCILGSFKHDFTISDDEGEKDWVSWKDNRGRHRVLADEVVGVSWGEHD